jgi:DNA anti-recombination protein RmuC
MKNRLIVAVGLLGLVGGCENTTAGVKKDTSAATTAAANKADEAKRALDSEITTFRQQTGQKLQQLTVAIASLEAKAEDGLSDSGKQIQQQIEETRGTLQGLKAASREEWEETRTQIDARVAKLGKQINETLDDVGDSVQEKLE